MHSGSGVRKCSDAYLKLMSFVIACYIIAILSATVCQVLASPS